LLQSKIKAGPVQFGTSCRLFSMSANCPSRNVIRNSNTDFRIDPYSDPDVCQIAP